MSEDLKNPTKNTQKEPRNGLLFQTPSILHTMGMVSTSARFEAASDGSSFPASGSGLLEPLSKDKSGSVEPLFPGSTDPLCLNLVLQQQTSIPKGKL
jgi:hypothetical protein